MTKSMKAVCKKCRGENVKADAFATWSVEFQWWEVDNVFDKGAYCDDCNGETRIEMVEAATEGKKQ